MAELEPFFDLLKYLLRQPSVVGAEHAFFRVLQRELEERGAQVTWYEGLLVAHGSDPGRAMFSAHIDRHGLICTGPNEFQYAAFVAGNRSDLLGNSVSETLMRKIVDRFADTEVIAYEPWSGVYRGCGRIDSAYICDKRNNLIFNVQGLEHLVAGTPVSFNDRLRMESGWLAGQLDNALSAALLVHLFSLGFQGTCFFTAQEEAGRSWRYLLEWFRRFGGSTSRLVVVDTSPFPDRDTVLQQQLVLRYRDANAAFDQDTTDEMARLCDQLGLSYLFKDRYIEQQNEQARQQGRDSASLGSTELGRIVAASGGFVTGTTLQIPSCGYHTMEESTPLASVEACLRLMRVFSGLD